MGVNVIFVKLLTGVACNQAIWINFLEAIPVLWSSKADNKRGELGCRCCQNLQNIRYWNNVLCLKSVYGFHFLYLGVHNNMIFFNLNWNMIVKNFRLRR